MYTPVTELLSIDSTLSIRRFARAYERLLLTVPGRCRRGRRSAIWPTVEQWRPAITVRSTWYYTCVAPSNAAPALEHYSTIDVFTDRYHTSGPGIVLRSAVCVCSYTITVKQNDLWPRYFA